MMIHDMEMFSHITGPLWVKQPVACGFASHRWVIQSCNVFFAVILNIVIILNTAEHSQVRSDLKNADAHVKSL